VDRIGSFSIPVMEMNRRTYTSNEITAWRNTGWIRYGTSGAQDYSRWKCGEFRLLLPTIGNSFWMRGMSTSASELSISLAIDVKVTEATLNVDLSDGRSLSVPLSWYPRLDNATPAERDKWEFIGDGRGIHWPDIDEDISVQGLLAGKPSNESQASLRRWLDSRRA
jgi:hypothetical protein